MNGRIRFFLSLVLALLVVLTLVPAWAQTATTGQVTGAVTDPSGAVVPNASVTLKSTDTGRTQTAKTNAAGLYNFSLVQPGNYTLTVNAQGFQASSRNLTVALGSNTAANLQLSLSSTSETLEVTGNLATVETEDANLNTTFDARQVSLLPNPGNDLSAVALTSPGVVMNTTGGSVFGGGNYEFYGLPSNSNVFTYDGANANDPFFNINSSGATNLTLGLNDVQETSVVTNGYSGQYGGLAGANINYISKSGSNAFHGNAIYWWNGRALNANNYFLNQSNPPAERPFVNANQYAASFGGPIKKDKAFFFVDYEGIRLFIPSLFSVNIPTQQFETATINNLNSLGLSNSVSYYQNLFNIWNNSSGASRATNTLLPGADPTGAANGNGCANIVASGAFAAFGAGGTPCALTYHGGTSQVTHDYLLVGRYDMNIGNNDKLFIRAQHESGLQATYTDPLTATFDANSQQPEWQSQLSETHTFGTNQVNNFVASMQWYSALFTMVDVNKANALLPNTLNIADGSLFNINNLGSFFPQGRNITQYSLVDDYSWLKGKHNFKFGVNFRRDDVSDHNFGLVTPFVQAESLLDFANGGILAANSPGSVASVAEQFFPVQSNVPLALYQLGWYVSDDWKATPNLKLTLTMRFDHLSNPVCQTNCFTRLAAPFNQLNPAAPVNQAILTGQHTAFPSVTGVVYEPKVGFAYSPLGSKNTVIRGGVGIFSDAIPSLAIDSILDNAPNDPSFVVANNAIATTEANNLLGSLAAANANFRANFASGGAVTPFNFFNPGKVVVPRYYEWHLEVQQALGWHSTVSAKYVGNHGTHEEITNPALNAFSPLSPAPFANLPVNQPDPRFGVVAQTQNIANSNYNGMVLTFAHNFSGGFQFQAGYTYSHALDEISNNSLNPFGVNSATNADIVFPIDQTNIKKFNYGNADYDVRHSFNMNYVWSDAFRHLTSRGPKALVAGWTFSGTIFDHTGFPYTIYSSADTGALHGSNWGSNAAATGTSAPAVILAFQHPNCGASAAHINNPCYSAANFTNETVVGNFGNQRRNQFRGPGYFDTDFSVEKAFNIPKWETAQFSIGARFFNLFNHPNFAFPVTDIDNPQFGQILNTVSQPTTIYGSGLGADASPRVIEIQGKFTF